MEKKIEKMGILLAAPALSFSLVIFVYPLFFNFCFSFFWYQGYSPYPPIYVGLDNYIAILSDTIFHNALFNTFLFTIFSVLFEFMIGLVMALLLSRLRSVWLELLSAMCVIPLFLSDVIEGVIGTFLFAPRLGLISSIGRVILGIEVPWLTDRNFALWSVILVDAWKMSPFFIIIFLAAIMSIPKDLTEAITIDGASEIQRIRYLIVPYMLPVFAISAIMRAIDAFTKVFGVVYVMTAGGPGISTDVIPLRIFNLALRAFQWGRACTWGVFAFIFSLVMAIVYFYVRGRWRI